LYQIVYASSALDPWSRTELDELVNRCRENNARIGVTGMLLHKRGKFLHALEGFRETVGTLYVRIAADRRHRCVGVLLEGALEERQFPGTPLAFHDLDSANALATPGYGEFLGTSLAEEEFLSDPARALKLLLTFKGCLE
jgi:hypothetical protein